MRYLIIILLALVSLKSFSQSTGELMFTAGIDVIKSDINSAFDKVQTGAELNYFVSRKFSVTGGFEYWSASNNSAVIGFRWYPANNIITRYRGLIGVDDFSFGVGYAKPFSSQFRVEGIGDYYINGQDFGIRVGIAYIFRKKE